MIRVEIVNVFLTEKGDEFIILLRGTGDNRSLPISIGQLEAQAIATQLYQVELPRPMTHDLFKTALENTGGKVTRVVITDLVDSTFYARLSIEKNKTTTELDARPSDAIALALRFGAPIFVEERVMDTSGVLLPDNLLNSRPAPQPSVPEDKPPASENLNDQLLRAIKEERYEDAAHLRDRLNKLSKTN